MKEILKKLSETYAISGYEKRIIPILQEMVKDHVDSIEIDALGNLICKTGNGQPTYLITAHMDEIGFIVKHIDDEGHLRFVPIGGHWDGNIINQRVVVHTKQKLFHGSIQCKSPMVMDKDEKEKITPWKDLFIDIGARNKQEVEEWGIKISDQVTFDQPFVDLANGRFMGKAMDNRSGCAILIELLKQLNNFNGTLYAVFSSQEEVGLKGAKVVAHKIRPDYVIALDISVANSPLVNKWDLGVELGKGVALQHMEAAGRGLIANPKLLKFFKDTALENNIPLQLDMTCAGSGGMTDAAVMQLTREGYPTISLGPGIKYFHTANEMIELQDVENTTKLLKAVIEKGIELNRS